LDSLSEESIHEIDWQVQVEVLVNLVILKNLTQKIDLKLIIKVDDYLFKTDRNYLDIHTHRALFNHYVKVILPMKSLGGKFFSKLVKF
jgi:hypothetical protein